MAPLDPIEDIGHEIQFATQFYGRQGCLVTFLSLPVLIMILDTSLREALRS
jgi:hypothetical protein